MNELVEIKFLFLVTFSLVTILNFTLKSFDLSLLFQSNINLFIHILSELICKITCFDIFLIVMSSIFVAVS